jgi:hypothetical protein
MLDKLEPGMVIQADFKWPQDNKKSKSDHHKTRRSVVAGKDPERGLLFLVPITSLGPIDAKYSVPLSPGAKRNIRGLDDRPSRVACDTVNAVIMPTDVIKRQHNKDGTSSWDCGKVPNAVLKEIIKRKDLAIADGAINILPIKPDPTVMREMARARQSSVGSSMKPTASRDQRVLEIGAARAAKETPRREYKPNARPTLKLAGSSR